MPQPLFNINTTVYTTCIFNVHKYHYNKINIVGGGGCVKITRTLSDAEIFILYFVSLEYMKEVLM